MIKKLSIGDYTLRAEEYTSSFDNKKTIGITLYKNEKEILHCGRSSLKSLNDDDMKEFLQNSIKLVDLLKEVE